MLSPCCHGNIDIIKTAFKLKYFEDSEYYRQAEKNARSAQLKAYYFRDGREPNATVGSHLKYQFELPIITKIMPDLSHRIFGNKT